jgi:hypothetical protein
MEAERTPRRPCVKMEVERTPGDYSNMEVERTPDDYSNLEVERTVRRLW